MQTAHPRRWTALAVIALAQFMVIMDTSVIGVALPEIRGDLRFTPRWSPIGFGRSGSPRPSGAGLRPWKSQA